MRYIDAEALTDSMLEHYNELCKKYGDYDHYTTGYGDAIDAIENAPTADVVQKGEVVSEIFWDILQYFNDAYKENKISYDFFRQLTYLFAEFDEKYTKGEKNGENKE